MKQILKDITLTFALLLALLVYFVASAVYHAGTKSPDGMSNASEYFQRFGEPSFIRMVEREGQTYYEFNGHVDPPWWCLALPSGPPAYIFDERGTFVEWCYDPGDTPSYRRRWPFKSTDHVNVAEVKRKFGF